MKGDRGHVRRLFGAVVAVNCVINIDSGVLPAMLKELMEEFKIEEGWLGFLGAMPYLGTAVSSPLWGQALSAASPRIVVAWACS